MKVSTSTDKAEQIVAIVKLERAVLKATMRRYREHRRMYGKVNGGYCTTKAMKAMYDACEALHEATHK